MTAPRPRKLLTLEPIGLRLPHAAEFVGVSPSKFSDWVERGLMPRPKMLDRVRVWDRRALIEAFELLPGDDVATGWEDVA